MKLLENILVPIDVNINSTDQINDTIYLAKDYKSESILMFVISDTQLSDKLKPLVIN